MDTTHSIAAILFDLNGTLIHQIRTERSHIASTYATLAPNQWNITFEAFEKAWNKVYNNYAQQSQKGLQLLQNGDLNAARKELYEPWYRANIAAILAELDFPASNRLIERITWAFQDSWVGGLTMPEENRAVLEELATNYQLGIVTNFQQPNIIPDILIQFGLEEFFDPVIISADVGYRKPHPDLFRYALQDLGMVNTPELVAYIGDSQEADIVGASFAGLYPILVTEKQRTEFVNPVCHIKCLTELPGVLSSM